MIRERKKEKGIDSKQEMAIVDKCLARLNEDATRLRNQTECLYKCGHGGGRSCMGRHEFFLCQKFLEDLLRSKR